MQRVVVCCESTEKVLYVWGEGTYMARVGVARLFIHQGRVDMRSLANGRRSCPYSIFRSMCVKSSGIVGEADRSESPTHDALHDALHRVRLRLPDDSHSRAAEPHRVDRQVVVHPAAAGHRIPPAQHLLLRDRDIQPRRCHSARLQGARRHRLQLCQPQHGQRPEPECQEHDVVCTRGELERLLPAGRGFCPTLPPARTG